MPSGMGGLIRYFDEYKSRISVSPGTVIVICIAVIVLILILRMFAGRAFGL